MRNHLYADALYAKLREDFAKVPDHRAAHTQISLSDALMSGLAMFCLNDPSLLAFERRRQNEADSLYKNFYIAEIYCNIFRRYSFLGNGCPKIFLNKWITMKMAV
ncbi:MAG: hypothetical protein CSA33_00050 [Desulfobulbus propionicus]|nr:MAG: hypothetical protein CSA33_00050 [Desulfobulbus propionicus]